MALTEKLVSVADAIRVQSGKTAKLTLAQMPGEILALQALNFEVTGNPQPDSPKENTIWLDTDTPVTGWVFSAAQPEAAQEGMVWFCTGDSSPVAFNALKKNVLITNPLSAMQYAGGVWVDKTAKSYQNGEWVDWWNGELYDNGNEYTAFTGGWEATSISSTTNFTKDSTSMTITTDYGDDALYCSEKIDLTPFKTLVVDGMSFRNNSAAERRAGNTKVCVWSSIGSSVTSGRVAYVDYPAADYDDEIELDVSDLAGAYYVGVFAGRYYGVTVRKARLLQ